MPLGVRIGAAVDAAAGATAFLVTRCRLFGSRSAFSSAISSDVELSLSLSEVESSL